MRLCAVCWHRSPALLSSESLIEQSQYLGHIELDIFQVKLVLVIFLHLQQVVKLQVKLEKPPVSACISS